MNLIDKKQYFKSLLSSIKERVDNNHYYQKQKFTLSDILCYNFLKYDFEHAVKISLSDFF